nr:unnamed protein product [Callosobruchus analis]
MEKLFSAVITETDTVHIIFKELYTFSFFLSTTIGVYEGKSPFMTVCHSKTPMMIFQIWQHTLSSGRDSGISLVVVVFVLKDSSQKQKKMLHCPQCIVLLMYSPSSSFGTVDRIPTGSCGVWLLQIVQKKETLEHTTSVVIVYILLETSSFRVTCKMAIRYLATGCYFTDLHYAYRLGKSTVTEIVQKTCYVIWRKLQNIVMREPTKLY